MVRLTLPQRWATGRPVRTAGLVADGVEARLLVRRVERLDAACVSLMARALDSGTLLLCRKL